MVLLELITCRLPWCDVSGPNFVISQKVAQGERPKLTKKEKREANQNDGQIMIEWMERCWVHNSKKRPTFLDALHAFRKVNSVKEVYLKDRKERSGNISSSSISTFDSSNRNNSGFSSNEICPIINSQNDNKTEVSRLDSSESDGNYYVQMSNDGDEEN